MGMFGPIVIVCPAGEWTTIISNAFVQMPTEWIVEVATTDQTPVSGLYLEKKSRWILPGNPVQGILVPRMVFERGYWNTFHSVRVRPDRAVTVSVR